ncbi:hypothetical protein L1887_25775 [Cichorium endivia]|nr:hypothetical protein L1887_25775 [Cichorium endivia]
MLSNLCDHRLTVKTHRDIKTELGSSALCSESSTSDFSWPWTLISSSTVGFLLATSDFIFYGGFWLAGDS